ncbi:PilZ domain-containing protein [Brevibacillus laterosporus]|uniref:PilZ domain-containing protein n=2 Tax=Brevibacillus laterosporus TaxID=1465 RepID=UPI001F09FF0E|nr:PilZ domain-containing protein [Brevibacillus laterosporus]
MGTMGEDRQLVRGTIVHVSRENESVALKDAMIEYQKGDYLLLSCILDQANPSFLGCILHVRFNEGQEYQAYEVYTEKIAWPVVIMGLLPVRTESVAEGSKQQKGQTSSSVESSHDATRQAILAKLKGSKQDASALTNNQSSNRENQAQQLVNPDFIINVPYKRMGAKPNEELGEGVLLSFSEKELHVGTDGYLAKGDFVNLSFVIPRTKTEVVAMTKVIEKRFDNNITIVTLSITDVDPAQHAELIAYHKTMLS